MLRHNSQPLTLTLSKLITRDAEVIAQKLNAEVATGRKHVIAKVRCGGVHIGQFNIRRGSNVGHDYIPNQIFVTMRQALELARCTLDADDYKRILQARGKIPNDPAPNA